MKDDERQKQKHLHFIKPDKTHPLQFTMYSAMLSLISSVLLTLFLRIYHFFFYILCLIHCTEEVCWKRTLCDHEGEKENIMCRSVLLLF